MIIAFMEGDPKAVFREQLAEHRRLLKKVENYEKAFRKFANDECRLYRPDWIDGPARYCHSAVHPDGYGERRECTITKCTWYREEAFKLETCDECRGSGLVLADYPRTRPCPKCKS